MRTFGKPILILFFPQTRLGVGADGAGGAGGKPCVCKRFQSFATQTDLPRSHTSGLATLESLDCNAF